MGRASNLYALLELYGARPRPHPLPDDPKHPCYLPFCDETFLATAHLTGNPLCPPAPTRPHALNWNARMVMDADHFARHYMSLGSTKTDRCHRETPGQCPKGERQWWTLRDALGTPWMIRLAEALDAAGHGLDAILADKDSILSELEMLNGFDLVLLKSILFSKELVLSEDEEPALSDFLRFTAKRIVIHWQNLYKSERKIAAELEADVRKAWKKIGDSSLPQLRMVDVRRFVKAFGLLRAHVGTRVWVCDADVLDEYVQFCEDTAAALGVHTDSAQTARLPPAFISQLKALAPAQKDEIVAEFQRLAAEDIESGGSVDISHIVDLGDCSAELMKKDMETLWAMIGCDDGAIPSMARWLSASADFNSWSPEPRRTAWKAATEAASRGEETSLQPFALLKHQLVGVIQMLVWFMNREPGLLLDDVGLGKTIQTLALAALIAWFSHEYERTGRFPGTLFAGRHYKHLHPLCTGDDSCPVRQHDCTIPGSHRKCTGDPETCQARGVHGNFPDFPSLVAAPPTLATQWVAQANSLLENGAMTVLPFVVPNEKVRGVISRQHVLNEASKFHALGKTSLFIVISIKALEHEFGSVTGWRAPQARKHGIHAPYPAVPDGAYSIYGLHTGIVFIDEIQLARSVRSIKFHALRMLKDRATIAIGLTATPIITGVEDAVTMGLTIGHPKFADKTSYDLFIQPEITTVNTLKNKALAARRAERAALKEFDRDRQATDAAEMLQTEGALVRPSTDIVAIGKIALNLRGFIQNVIRRTLADVGHDNGLPPLTTVTIEMFPGAQELDAMKQVHKALMGGQSRPVATALSQQFYLHGRRTAIHWCLAMQDCPIDYRKFPSSISNYLDNASVKLDAVRHLVQSHLQNRQLPPQTAHFRNGVNEWTDGTWGQQLEAGELARDPNMPQKIVVYTFFVDALNIIKRLLELDGHRVFAIDGQTKLDKRATTLDEWLAHDGPCVLIITTIGTAGLNLQNADVLIILDPTWSGSDAAQLAGRIYRKGQKSRTVVYTIVVRKSADVLILAISGPKKFINDSFLRETRSLLETLHLDVLPISRDGTPLLISQMGIDLRRAQLGDFSGSSTVRPRLNLLNVQLDWEAIEDEVESSLAAAAQRSLDRHGHPDVEGDALVPWQRVPMPQLDDVTGITELEFAAELDSAAAIATLESPFVLVPYADIPVGAYGGRVTDPGAEAALLGEFDIRGATFDIGVPNSTAPEVPAPSYDDLDNYLDMYVDGPAPEEPPPREPARTKTGKTRRADSQETSVLQSATSSARRGRGSSKLTSSSRGRHVNRNHRDDGLERPTLKQLVDSSSQGSSQLEELRPKHTAPRADIPRARSKK